MKATVLPVHHVKHTKRRENEMRIANLRLLTQKTNCISFKFSLAQRLVIAAVIHGSKPGEWEVILGTRFVSFLTLNV